MFYLLSLEGGLVRGSFCTNFHSSMVQTMEFRFNVSARALNVCTYKCLHAMMKNGHRKLVKTANFSFSSKHSLFKREHSLNKIISQFLSASSSERLALLSTVSVLLDTSFVHVTRYFGYFFCTCY